MRLVKLSVTNFRSIKSCINVRIEPLQGFVGENNAGKSNMLAAIDCFLSAGSAGVTATDFNDQAQPIVIEAEFSGLAVPERKRVRSYLIGDRLILQKQFAIATDPKTGKLKIETEYHGYKAEPRDWWLSTEKVVAQKGNRPKWEEIAEQNGIVDYVRGADGKVTKASYEAGLSRLLTEREDIVYEEPTLGQTQALGIQQNLLSALPQFYLLPAITDYSDEVDRRSTTTVFRQLMADLSDRIMRADPRYQEIESALGTLRALLNPPAQGGPAQAGQQPTRLPALAGVETTLRDTIRRMMPSVQGVQLLVEVEETKEIFSKGVSIKVDDGVLTPVIDKGHGMQRSIVFALLQMLIESARAAGDVRPIILGIEEPELYIHPHSQRLLFGVLKEFAGIRGEEPVTGTDQVLYTTHCPAFIDVANYERIGVVRKESAAAGTVLRQAEAGVLGSPDERKAFKLLTSFGLKHNEVFFARHAILVEGPEDEVGIIATARKLGVIKDLPDEIGLSIAVTDGKGELPKFQKVLDAFGFSYGVLLELDGNPETDKQNAPILENLKGNRVAKVPKRIEDLLGVGKHFDDQRHAKEFFPDPARINAAMEKVVTDLLP